MNPPRYTRVPYPEPPSLLPPRSIPMGRPSAFLNFVSIMKLKSFVNAHRRAMMSAPMFTSDLLLFLPFEPDHFIHFL